MSEMNDSKDELSVHLDVHSNEGDVVDVVKYATDVLNNGLLNGQEEEEEEADDGEDSNGNHHGNIPRHCLKGPSSHDLGEHRDETDVKDDDAVAVDIDRFRMEMESMGEININGLSGDQPVFPTIEAMRTVQQQRKKRQFSSIIDEDIKEFQRWTSRFLVDALDDSTTDVAIEDSDEYGFPQTTAEHFTDPVDDSGFKRKKIVKNETPDTHATDRKGSDSNLHEQNDVIVDVGQQNGIDLSKKKVNIIKFEGLDIDKEEHLHTTKNEENVDPELSKFDSNTFSDDLINVSLEYLQRRIESGHVGEKIADGADNDVGNRTVDGDNNEDADDDENLAVEEVNRVVNQAVAAVRADAASNEGVEHIEDVKELDGDGDEEHGADTDVIAAAIVAAENAVRKRLKIDSMGTLDQIKDISIPITNEPTLTTDQSSSKVLNFQKVKVGADGGGLETSTKPKKANKKNATTKQTVSKAKKNKEKRDEFELLIKGKLDEAIKKAREKIADLSINSRSFTKEEMDAIDIFIKEYQKVHVMTHEAFLKRIWGNERKKDKFWEVVQHVLPNRTRSSLYKHIRRTYHIFEKRGVWTPEEDKKLKELTETCDGKWKEIGEIMKRMPEDCRDRWRNYVKCGESRNVNKWTKEEEDRLKEIITQVLDHARKDIDGKEQPIREAQVAPTINWNIISEMMGGTRSRIQCRYKWKKIMKMESVNKLQKMDSDTQQWLIERLYELSEKDPHLEANLDWDALALTAPSSKIIWNGVDLSTCFARLKTRVDWKGKTFFEIVAQLRDALSPAKCVAQLENNQVWNVEGETH